MRFVDGALAVPRLFLLLLVLAVPDRVPLAALVWLLVRIPLQHARQRPS